MKKSQRIVITFSFFVLFLILSIPVYSQCERIVFSYDNAGNRIKREHRTDCPPPMIKKEEMSGSFSLHPNPAQNNVILSITDIPASQEDLFKIENKPGLENNSFSEADLVVLNNSGAIVIQKKIYSTEVTLDVSSLSSGIYYCKVIMNDQEKTKRFFIIK